ncbi:MAG: leucine-rich repeat domain-containing protein [Clostridia bacterium]|nr:leucine-rich repeat domain-containing protein [Clostridia bacterium]
MMKKVLKILAVLLAPVLVAGCFSGCNILDMTAVRVSYEKTDTEVFVKGYTDRTTITELVIPDEVDGLPVTKILDFGVCNAESLTKITIGKNVTEIGGWGMTNNQHLLEFVVDPANTAFKAEDGVLFSKDGKTLIYYPPAKGIEFDKFGSPSNIEYDEEGNPTNMPQYEIPDGVETIRTKAFYKCSYVNVTRFPDSITRIEEKAFHRCSELLDFKMPSHIEYIGKDAFAYDSKLKNIEIPATITEIGDFAFFSCTGMESIRIGAKEADVTLGNRWQPTEKGRIKKSCVIEFAQ